MTTSNPPPAIAYFVTSHGYGHAARSTAIMAALQKINPALQFHIFTQTPRYFLEDSLTGPFTYHTLMTDIGVAQQSSLTEDRVTRCHPYHTPVREPRREDRAPIRVTIGIHGLT